MQNNSSIFSIHFPSVLYPIFPAEVVDSSSPHEEAAVAHASAVLYANFSCDDSGPSGYPEPPFETCVDAGWGALTVFSVSIFPSQNYVQRTVEHYLLVAPQALAHTLPTAAIGSTRSHAEPPLMHGLGGSRNGTQRQVTPRVLADQFERYLVAYGANSSNLLA